MRPQISSITSPGKSIVYFIHLVQHETTPTTRHSKEIFVEEEDGRGLFIKSLLWFMNEL